MTPPIPGEHGGRTADEVWEPWTPRVGDRVRVRLSSECRVTSIDIQPPPTVRSSSLTELCRSSKGDRYQTSTWVATHPVELDGAEGEVIRVFRHDDMVGHFYRVAFSPAVPIAEVGDCVGIDLAAAELLPVPHDGRDGATDAAGEEAG